MAEEAVEPLLDQALLDQPTTKTPNNRRSSSRVASLDVFRGLCVLLMMVVDYGGYMLPIIAHSPWNGLHLADFIMPFFLFAAGLSLALVYKKVSNRVEATWKAFLRALELFLLGVLLQGGYFHGINSLTYGVDIDRIRWLGILQRISIGHFVAALCEIWLSCRRERDLKFFWSYRWHWCAAFTISAVYLGLQYGLYVPDWQFETSDPTGIQWNGNHVYKVKCSLRGDLGPACNSAGMIDRSVIGMNHLYAKPVYRNIKECNISATGQIPQTSPSWCHAPFDPEGLLRFLGVVGFANCGLLMPLALFTKCSLTAAVTCIMGLQYGHILAHLQDHKGRVEKWLISSLLFLVLGVFLTLLGIPVNKSLYTISYMLITSASAGLTFCALYLFVDVYDYRRGTSLLEWMGIHSLGIFVLITSNLAVIAIQGFYWTLPQNNLIHWIVSCFVRR